MNKILQFLSGLTWFPKILISGNFWFGIIIGAVITHFFVVKKFLCSNVTISLPFGLGNITYEATDKDRVLAWKMYIQLKTRKAALPFNIEHDIIIDVFDSIYKIFNETRDLLSEIKPHQQETQKSVADFVLRVLNDGIRPFLTKWQAGYRRWWNVNIVKPENQSKTPQEIQKEYPEHDLLIKDLIDMNVELVKCSEELLQIVHSKPSRRSFFKRKVSIAPEKPQ